MSRVNATNTDSILDDITVQRAINIYYNNGFLDGKEEQRKKDIDKAWKFIESIAEYTGMDMFDLEQEYKKAMEDEV